MIKLTGSLFATLLFATSAQAVELIKEVPASGGRFQYYVGETLVQSVDISPGIYKIIITRVAEGGSGKRHKPGFAK